MVGFCFGYFAHSLSPQRRCSTADMVMVGLSYLSRECNFRADFTVLDRYRLLYRLDLSLYFDCNQTTLLKGQWKQEPPFGHFQANILRLDHWVFIFQRFASLPLMLGWLQAECLLGCSNTVLAFAFVISEWYSTQYWQHLLRSSSCAPESARNVQRFQTWPSPPKWSLFAVSYRVACTLVSWAHFLSNHQHCRDLESAECFRQNPS